ncbi:hypothetical protein DN752_09300 [Echinicola strongylocentroti]|uniref:Uncharacterized protein n=1 Tax=Echinicola strongylocentroti TaxID=1795355 RepID=A0A2Z4IQM0_9BACT|nr:hypothetical protein DN752_09300 [Echinicola strongylocentroti]
MRGQIVKEFVVEEKSGFDRVQLNFSSYKGVSDINKMYMSDPVMIHSHLSKVNILPDFSYHIQDAVLTANLNHSDVEQESFGKRLSSKLFATSEGDFDHTWEVGLSEQYAYLLDLHFGIGQANVDLSNLKVKRCKITTATADVSLNYMEKGRNLTEMDTLLVKVNMGTVDGVNMTHANARNMIFEVNYGQVNLNFDKHFESDKPCHIMTTVGAGAVYILLPAPQNPYLVKINSTAMCRKKLPSYLTEVGDKVYASKGYEEGVKNLITFEIDVSVGSLVLK